MKRSVSPKLGIVCSLFVLSACNLSNSLVPEKGQYEGTWIHSNESKLLSSAVTAEISDIQNDHAEIDVAISDSSEHFTIQLSNIASSSLVLGMPVSRDLPALSSAQLLLVLDRQGGQNCFTAQSSFRAKLCPSTDSLTLEIYDHDNQPLISLTLDHFEPQAKPVLETPRAYTLEDAMKRTFAMEFSTRIEFKRVMEARHQAANAYLNLLPHLSTNSILAVITSSDVVGLLGAIGDLAPFLLPNRWSQANQAQHLADAEHDALVAMRGDAGAQTEGLAYAYARDRKLAAIFADGLAEIQKIQAKIAVAEKAGIYQAGTADMFASLQINTESDAAALDLVIEEEKTFIAQALGMMNPQAVTDLTVAEPALPIEQAHDLDSADFQDTMLSHSFELRQMDALIAAAHAAETSSLFSWMDPTCDPTQGLGFGLGEAVAVQADKIEELKINREQVQAILLQKIANTVSEYNDSLEDHERTLRNLAIQERRMARELAALEAGTQANVLDLITAIPARLQALMNLRNTEAAYRLSRAKLDRLTLQGYYTQIPHDPI